MPATRWSKANGGGTDLVQSSVTFTLAQFFENLTLTGSGNVDGTGNSLANTITGNSGDNDLTGGGGADTLIGLGGDDTYEIDNFGVTVTEAVTQGTDLVRTSVSHVLAANVENLILTGNANANGTGNDLDNQLTGNAGNNALNGGVGADTMAGGAGDDTYTVDNLGDTVVEANNGGTDLIRSSITANLGGKQVENLTLIGGGDINGSGNSFDNTITGNGGDNVLNGVTGSDTLTGAAGSDTFVFANALGASNIDSITDFNVAGDTIRLDSAIFNTIVGTGVLTPAQFVANASGTAADADDRIIYETDTGNLFFDSNGTGAGGSVQFAHLDAGLALTNADFFVV
jgi:Ca2+-binding RTX toxin-like protein